jgi:hypothetical protein
MKKIIITMFACLVLFGFTLTGAFAQTWTWDGPYEIATSPKYIEIAADPNDDAYLVGLIEGGGIDQIPTTDSAADRVQAQDTAVDPVVDLIVGPDHVTYAIDMNTVGTWNGSDFVPFALLDQPYVPADAQDPPVAIQGEYKSLAAGKNGKLYVLFETADKQYLLVGNPPFTAIAATVRFTPRSLNLGSKGNWVSCSIGGLPEGYSVDWANPEAVCITAINGDTEVEGLPICRKDGPVNAGTKMKVKFSRQDLATAITNAGSPSSVSLTVAGYVSSGEEDFEFTGTDTFKTKAKKVK